MREPIAEDANVASLTKGEKLLQTTICTLSSRSRSSSTLLAEVRNLPNFINITIRTTVPQISIPCQAGRFCIVRIHQNSWSKLAEDVVRSMSIERSPRASRTPLRSCSRRDRTSNLGVFDSRPGGQCSTKSSLMWPQDGQLISDCCVSSCKDVASSLTSKTIPIGRC